VALGLCLGLACCELVINTSHLDSDDGSDGGVKEGAPGPDAQDSGDAKMDGRAPRDGKSPVDDGPPVDAGPFCASQVDAQFCADFDDGSVNYAVPVSWPPPFSFHGTMSLDEDVRVSPPASLRVDLAPSEAGVDADRSVTKLGTGFTATISKFHVAFDLLVDVRDTMDNSQLQPFDVSLGLGNDYFELTFELASPSSGGAGDSGACIYYQLYMDAASPIDQHLFSFARAPTAGDWTHVDISFTLSSTIGTLYAAFNDASVLDGVQFEAGGYTQNPYFELGGTAYWPTAGWVEHIDNFVVWFE
jgi:hypothetical protein